MMKKDGQRPSITQVITKLKNKIIELEKKRDLLATNQTFTTPVQAGTLPKEGKLGGSNDGSPLNPKPSGPKQDV